MKRIFIGLALITALAFSSCGGNPTGATNITNTSATLNSDVNWSAGDGPGNFWQEYKTSNSSVYTKGKVNPFPRLESSGSSKYSENITNLAPGTQYVYRLCMLLDDGRGGCTGTSSFSTTGTTALSLVGIGSTSSFAAPMDFDSPQSGRNFIAERNGVIRLSLNGTLQTTPFLNISSRVDTGGEGGLEAVAFAPDYASSGKFYVYFVETLEAGAVGGDVRIEEFTRSSSNPNVADPNSSRLILEVEHSSRNNHYGGGIGFGSDNLLYVSTGDGGGANDPDGNGQNLSTLQGKLHRINPANLARTLVAYGLRNPFRLNFDRQTGDLILADVGQDNWEEINFLPAPIGTGTNFGWPCREGLVDNPGHSCTISGYRDPALVRPNQTDSRSIVPGVPLRNASYGSWQGKMIYGDYFATALRVATLFNNGNSGDTATSLGFNHLVNVAQDSCGRVYFVSLDGPVRRLEATANPAQPCQ